MEQSVLLQPISDKILLSLVTVIRKLNTSTKLNFKEKSCAKIFSFHNKLRLNLCGGKIKKGENGRNETRKGVKRNETRLQWTESEYRKSLHLGWEGEEEKWQQKKSNIGYDVAEPSHCLAQEKWLEWRKSDKDKTWGRGCFLGTVVCQKNGLCWEPQTVGCCCFRGWVAPWSGPPLTILQ